MSVVTQFTPPPPLRLSAGSAISCILRPTAPMCTAPSVPARSTSSCCTWSAARKLSPDVTCQARSISRTARITAERMAAWPADTLFVVYCAGPHCNGADVAALKLAELGRPVKMMLGGLTGWEDEGYAFASGD
ncbi:Rhodanese-related sulfurtransferase [Klebsiella pneumoniae]|uniref:Rhodanese-related sulfurtransferase n=1 Tax=Klebsiella pneumoniae TaxID=573 RepID=A0A378B8H0_KLEPN|nr:Rhodanese-related sulfurtransferase [Klebsiella pneumoniae]